MARVKLYVVLGGDNYWRLRTDREAAQYLCEFPCERVQVILPNQQPIYLDNQMGTYKYLTLSHPNINNWIIQNGWNRNAVDDVEPLPFHFSVQGNMHIYEYLV